MGYNKKLFIVIIAILLISGIVALVYIGNIQPDTTLQNNNTKINNNTENQNKSVNDSLESNKKINTEIGSKIPLSTDKKVDKNNKIGFNIPKNTYLTYNKVLKIAERKVLNDEYVKIVGFSKIDGISYWEIQVYSKKTNKPTYGFAIIDKTGEISLF